MQSKLIEKLKAYILINNPELATQLCSYYSFIQYLEDQVCKIMPMAERLISEGKDAHVIEELCLNEMTAGLRPSRFNYIKEVMASEFSEEYERLVKTGVLTYETTKLLEHCKTHFEIFGFSEQTKDNRFLRHAVIAVIHDHFN